MIYMKRHVTDEKSANEHTPNIIEVIENGSVLALFEWLYLNFFFR